MSAKILSQDEVDMLLKGMDKSDNIGSALLEAFNILNGKRNDTYGTPENSFQRIANFWTIYRKHTSPDDYHFNPKDVAIMMILFKIARLQSSYTRDSVIDICGYAGALADMFPNKPISPIMEPSIKLETEKLFDSLYDSAGETDVNEYF